MTNGQAMNEELEDEMVHRTEGALMAAGDDALLSADRKRKKLLLSYVQQAAGALMAAGDDAGAGADEVASRAKGPHWIFGVTAFIASTSALRSLISIFAASSSFSRIWNLFTSPGISRSEAEAPEAEGGDAAPAGAPDAAPAAVPEAEGGDAAPAASSSFCAFIVL